MRDIKFRYIFKDIKENERTLIAQFWSLNDIEINDIVYDNEILIARNQYTGLKDKKGVEIYEGDILNHDGSLGCVSYINSGNCNVLGYVLSSLINNRIFYMFCDEADDYEIIGNIYENPELLRED